MCLAIPGQVVEFCDPERFLARVEVSGVRRIVNVALVSGGPDGVGVGDVMGRATFRKSSWRTGAWVGSSDTAIDNSLSAPPL